MNGNEISVVADSISFRQLRLFESVGRLSSVRQGSEECNISQPAVTQAIRKLEKELDEQLFERRSNGSYLTSQGEIFHKRVSRFLRILHDALVEAGAGSGKRDTERVANRISRSQARALIAIVDTASLEAAAALLDLTQTSLQRSARELEGNLRRSVYHRTAAGMMVTPRGFELGRRFKLAIKEIEWGIREMRDAHNQLTIGALPQGGSMLLATVLDAFAERFPAAEIKIITEGASEMVKRLRGGDVDMLIGLVQDTTADDLDNQILADTPYRIVCNPDHPLVDKIQVTREDLTGFQWIVGADKSNRRQAYENIFAGRSKPAKGEIATSALPIVRHLLQSSNRLALMTKFELLHEPGAFKEIAFEELEPRPAIGLTLRSDWQPTSLHEAFIDLLHATVRNSRLNADIYMQVA